MLSLSTYLGTRKSTTGRPQRVVTVPHKYRGTFTQALDDQGEPIDIYITDEGKVRLDVDVVRDELEAAGVFKGIEDDWGIDFNELREAEKADVVVVDGNEDEFEEDSTADPPENEDDDDDFVPEEEDDEDDEDDEMDDLVDENEEEDQTPVEEPEEDEENEDEDYEEDGAWH